jgi:cytochrome c
MDSFEITKIVGGLCGSLLIFLLIQTGAHALYSTHSEVEAYIVEVPEGEAGGPETPEEEVDVDALVADADSAKGETVFKKCAACHKTDGSDGVGPHLNGVVGRPVGSVAGFSYSDVLAGHGGDWTPEDLFHFVANPKGYAPGTKMSFAGLPKPEDRANLLAYLESLSQ